MGSRVTHGMVMLVVGARSRRVPMFGLVRMAAEVPATLVW